MNRDWRASWLASPWVDAGVLASLVVLAISGITIWGVLAVVDSRMMGFHAATGGPAEPLRTSQSDLARWPGPVVNRGSARVQSLVGPSVRATPRGPGSVAGVQGLLVLVLGVATLTILICLWSLVSLLHHWHVRETEQRRHQLMSQWAPTAGGLVHGLRNPLNAVYITLYRLQRAAPIEADEKLKDLCGRIRQQLERIDVLLGEFLEFARPEVGARSRVGAREVVERVVSFLEPEMRRRGIIVERQWPDRSPVIEIDVHQFEQIVLNLLLNAHQVVADGGRIQVHLAERSRWAILEIIDNGPGVPDTIRDRLFEPFVTTRPGAAGLGLATVRRLARDQGGRADLVATGPGGSAFRVIVPTCRATRSVDLFFARQVATI